MLYTNPVVANITIQFFAFFSSGPLYVLTVRQRRASLCNFHYYILSPNKMHRRDVPVGVPLDKCMARVTEV